MTESVFIGLVGDVMVGRLVNERLRAGEPIWGNTLPLFSHCDLNIANLEAALTRSEKMIPKVFNFKSDPQHVSHLSHFSAVNLANNHILDYGEEGLVETLETLDRAGIARVGAGRNLEEARRPVILEAKGLRIGLLGFTDNEPDWVATEESPGTRYIEVGPLEAVHDDIVSLRHHVDFLIASIHWGPNMVERPPDRFRTFARALLDLGVDVLHGHSAHIFQGVELHNQRCILYDTGDFLDDYAVDPSLRNDRSFFFTLEIDQEGLRHLHLTPIIIEGCQVHIATGIDADETLDRMEQLSLELGTRLERNHHSLRFDLTSV